MFDFWVNFSSSLKASIIIVAALCTLFILIGRKFDKLNPEDTPTGIALVMYLIVDFFNEFIKGHFKNKWKFFGPYLFAVVSYLIVSNIASCFGLIPPMANISVALSLSVLTFLMLQFTSFKFNSIKDKLKSYVGDVVYVAPINIPLNILGDFTTPLSMGLRLFGNLVSGCALSIIAFGFVDLISESFLVGGPIKIAVVTVLFHPIFDIMFGVIQAFVFFMLSTIFLASSARE